MLKGYQQKFIDFLISSEVLSFGDFTTKSGRKTPYFINAGRFDTGEKISTLGLYYAEHIISSELAQVDIVFGPAYKGVPLAVVTATRLFQDYQRNVGFAFDRKELKGHGEKGKFIGAPIKDGSKIVIVEDVITAGTTAREIVPLLKSQADVDILGMAIAVDRCEKGADDRSAVQQVQEELGIEVYPLVTVHQIKEYLSTDNTSGFKLSDELVANMEQYLATYGA